MNKTDCLDQFYDYIDHHLPIGVEIESLQAFHHDGKLIFNLWIDYNEFAKNKEGFKRIPNANDIFSTHTEREEFIKSYKKRIIEKYRQDVYDFLHNSSVEASYPEFINYSTPHVTLALLSKNNKHKTAIDPEIINEINKRNQEVLSTFTNKCLPDYSSRLSSLTVTSEDLIRILNKARQYNGNITLNQKEVFKMIVNADEYFSNIGDLDSFFSGLADSIVEYIKRQEVMEDIKNGTKTAADLSAT